MNCNSLSSNLITDVLEEDRRTRYTEGKEPCEDGNRFRVTLPQTKECQALSENT